MATANKIKRREEKRREEKRRAEAGLTQGRCVPSPLPA
jgi:hypothetical protein